tara:strand:+ start:307 stop:894 length:588 start_codon:yes stop_codon:yes gene_type:complete
MFKQLSIAVAALSASLAMSSNAATIPYPNIGTPAPTSSFVAEADGGVTAYFYATDAGYNSMIGMWVNGVPTGLYGLMNRTSSYGDSFFLGNVSAGDHLTFELKVLTTGTSWYSDETLNSDGKNHAYATNFGGGGLIPAGAYTYVAFEDLPDLGDFDYNDHQFVFTNIKTSVPEPFSLALFGLGIIALGVARKRIV